MIENCTKMSWHSSFLPGFALLVFSMIILPESILKIESQVDLQHYLDLKNKFNPAGRKGRTT